MSGFRIFLLGKTGLLGSALAQELKNAGYELIAPSHQELDLLQYQKVRDYAHSLKCQVIINCAGYNLVDDCEKNQERAFKLNAEVVENLAQIAKDTSAVFFHISTDYIFSGDKKTEYLEDDTPAPLNSYGQSKLQGELFLQKIAPEFCLIRTSWLFGPGGENFISKILKKWQSGAKELKVVVDERGRPTYSLDLARAIRLALEKNLRGIYHFCNQGQTSWYELAKLVFEILGEGPRLIPVRAEEYGLPAKRPKNSALSTEKIEQALGIKIRDHREAVKEYLELMRNKI